MHMQGMPPPEFVPLKLRVSNQERGQVFGLVLFVASALALVSLLSTTLTGKLLGDLYVRKGLPRSLPFPDHFHSHLVALQIVTLVCIGGTWTWRRWGIYGYFICELLIALLVFHVTGHPPMIDLVMLGGMIMAVLARLHMFE
jgi:hypothetical protein